MTSPEQARILIVDDERTIALTLARALRVAPDAHLTVDVCYTATDALVMLVTHHFNLVLTDLRLPGMSGLQLLAKIRGNFPGTRTILMTGGDISEIEPQARLFSDAFLTKPFEPAQVLKLVHDLTRTPRSAATAEMAAGAS